MMNSCKVTRVWSMAAPQLCANLLGALTNTSAATPANPLAKAASKANTVSLNPQPLPPSVLTPAQVPSALR